MLPEDAGLVSIILHSKEVTFSLQSNKNLCLHCLNCDYVLKEAIDGTNMVFSLNSDRIDSPVQKKKNGCEMQSQLAKVINHNNDSLFPIYKVFKTRSLI